MSSHIAVRTAPTPSGARQPNASPRPATWLLCKELAAPRPDWAQAGKPSSAACSSVIFAVARSGRLIFCTFPRILCRGGQEASRRPGPTRTQVAHRGHVHHHRRHAPCHRATPMTPVRVGSGGGSAGERPGPRRCDTAVCPSCRRTLRAAVARIVTKPAKEWLPRARSSSPPTFMIRPTSQFPVSNRARSAGRRARESRLRAQERNSRRFRSAGFQPHAGVLLQPTSPGARPLLVAFLR